jgi:Zn finger protein HypA/HybF involved in hydrogenase expression
MARINTVNVVLVKTAAERIKRDGHVTQREYQALNAAFMALKKQTPVKVEQGNKELQPNRVPCITIWECPRCHEDLGSYDNHKYCPHCGQALYWPDILGKPCDKDTVEEECVSAVDTFTSGITLAIAECISNIEELLEREEALSEQSFKLPYDKGYAFGRVTAIGDVLTLVKKLEVK